MNFQIVDIKMVPYLLPVVASWHHQQWSHLNPGQSLQSRVAKMQCYLQCAEGGFVSKLFVALQLSSNNKSQSAIASAALDHHDMDVYQELSPWLASVFVMPEYRKKGIASALIAHAIQFARQSDTKTLYLFTPDQARFYERRGWRVIQKINYYGEWVDLMSRNLG